MKKGLLILMLGLFSGALAAQAPRGASPVLDSTLIFPPQQEHTHGSSIVMLPGGDLLVAWFQGSGERTADDVRIMGARLKKGTRHWSKPFVLADTYGIPDCNPVLFLNHAKTLYLVWIAVQANRWENAILRLRTSRDYAGPEAPHWQWQDDILLKPDDHFAEEVARGLRSLSSTGAGWSAYAPRYDRMIAEAAEDAGKRSTGWMTRIHPLLLEDSLILLPLYSDGFNMSLVAISRNDGKTWQPSLPIVGRGNVQPALVRKKDGTLVAYMRDNGDAPARVQLSRSRDQGMSWSPATKSSIPNTASVEVCALADGRWAFVGNDIDDGRYRLSLYLSDDEGQTWAWRMHLDDDPSRKGSYSYPSMIQAADGRLHLTYSWQGAGQGQSIKYVIVDPNKLTRQP